MGQENREGQHSVRNQTMTHNKFYYWALVPVVGLLVCVWSGKNQEGVQDLPSHPGRVTKIPKTGKTNEMDVVSSGLGEV